MMGGAEQWRVFVWSRGMWRLHSTHNQQSDAADHAEALRWQKKKARVVKHPTDPTPRS